MKKPPASIARKRYSEFYTIKKIMPKEEKTLIEIFKRAIKKKDLMTVHVLFKAKLLNINITLNYRAWHSGECWDSTLIYYTAQKGTVDMVKLLILHG